jgi:hypothetical protein
MLTTEVIITKLAVITKSLASAARQLCGTITLMQDTPEVPDSSRPLDTTPQQQFPAEQSGGFFRSDDPAFASTDEDIEDRVAAETFTVSWTASEFIAYHKDVKWYIVLAISAIVLSASIYLIIGDILTAVFVLIAAAVLGIFAGRQPRELPYSVDDQSVTIGQKRYLLDNFRSFAVVPEGAFSSIIFMPLKRFAPTLTIYYAPPDEEKILAIIAECLPMTQHKPDIVDSFMRRIRF